MTGRPLAAGDRLEIVYGAGPARAQTDRYAERGSRFWIAVDGDGDGARAFLADSPAIDVRPGPPAALLVTLPSVARPGEKIRVALAVVDSALDTGVAFAGDAVFVDPPAGLALPASVHFDGSEGGRRAIEVVAREPGTYRLEVAAGELRARSNPLIVSAQGPRVLWGDLHGHSAFSDGTGLPEDYFVYARDVSALDVVALTDHDHWGILPLAEHPELWNEIRAQTRRFHAPGRFVTLLGFEWTSWIHGHRNVLYFGDDGPVIDSLAEATDTPAELWKALGDRAALSIPHHPAGGPIAIDWEVAARPALRAGGRDRLDPRQQRGARLAGRDPRAGRGPLRARRARARLPARIHRQRRPPRRPPGRVRDRSAERGGGLAAILSEERTREGVLRALRERRVYATNGARIVLRVALGGTPIGGVVPVAAGARLRETLFVSVIGTAPLERVEVVRSGAVVDGARARRAARGGARERARRPRRGRVRLRARGAARRRRGVVEPDLHRRGAVTTPRVSVLLPVRDAAATLAASLRSVSRQRLRELECIVVDDGSRDDEPRDRARHARGDPRFRVIAQPALGLVPALRAASPNAARRSSRGTTPTTACTAIASRSRSPRSTARRRSRASAVTCGCSRAARSGRACAPTSAGSRACARPRTCGARRSSSARSRTPRSCCAARCCARTPIAISAGPRTTTSCCACSRAGASSASCRGACSRGATRRTASRSAAPSTRPTASPRARRTTSRAACSRASERYWLWGYGGTGRALAKALRAHDRHPDAIVELHPRRIGQRIQGAPRDRAGASWAHRARCRSSSRSRAPTRAR